MLDRKIASVRIALVLSLTGFGLCGCQSPGLQSRTAPVASQGRMQGAELHHEIRREIESLEEPSVETTKTDAASAAPAEPATATPPSTTTPQRTAVVPPMLAALPPAAPPPRPKTDALAFKPEPLKKLKLLETSQLKISKANDTPLIFDIPVTYNDRVRTWVRYFQTEGRITFKNWLQRSARFMPLIQFELARANLPLDLGYVAMIESGFSSNAVSHAGAKGMWQFIVPTAKRYGLKVDWWIDERKDFLKATRAAIRYMSDLYQQFNSWYLVAASYNMGENGVRRLIQKYGTNNYWELVELGALPQETSTYVPKIIAAMLIAKAPGLYGFRELDYQMPLSYESVVVPGGTDIINLAAFLGVSERYLRDLNPELLNAFIPGGVRGHSIRVPKGSMLAVSQFIRLQAKVDYPRPAAD